MGNGRLWLRLDEFTGQAPEPQRVDNELWNRVLVADSEPMQGLLVVARRYVAVPDGGPPWFASLADQHVARAKRKPFGLILRKVHCKNLREIESIPLHVCVPKIRTRSRTSLACWREHLAKLNFAELSKGPATPRQSRRPTKDMTETRGRQHARGAELALGGGARPLHRSYLLSKRTQYRPLLVETGQIDLNRRNFFQPNPWQLSRTGCNRRLGEIRGAAHEPGNEVGLGEGAVHLIHVLIH